MSGNGPSPPPQIGHYFVVAEKASLVHDVDDTRTKDYGQYYTKQNPLRVESLPQERHKPGI